MKNAAFTILFTLTFFHLGFSQNMREELLRYDDENQKLIENGRRKLIVDLEQYDMDEYLKTYYFLEDSLENQDYLAFYLIEKIHSYYHMEHYDRILSILNSAPRRNSFYYEKNEPGPDILFRTLLQQSIDQKKVIYKSLNENVLIGKERDFLRLYFDYLISDSIWYEKAQDTLNKLSDSYLNNYPNSEFNTFIRQHIRYVEVTSKYGLGFDFCSGIGLYTSELQNSFNNYGIFGMGFEFRRTREVLFLRFNLGIGKTKQNLDFNNTIWNNGEQANTFNMEASLGYDIVDSKHFILTPFAGIGSFGVEPPSNDLEDNPDLENVGLDATRGAIFGVNMDFRFAQKVRYNNYYTYKENSYWFIRVRYSYNIPSYHLHYDGFNGAIHNINIGLGGFARFVRRQI